MTPEEQNQQIKDVVQDWLDKQGHERCWYYPDLFKKIVDIMEIKISEPQLPPRQEFEEGCKRFQNQEYGKTNSVWKEGIILEIKLTKVDAVMGLVILVQALILGYIIFFM